MTSVTDNVLVYFIKRHMKILDPEMMVIALIFVRVVIT